MAEPRVVIVGAGPAGVRAAAAVVSAGLTPIVIDESRRDGGRIYERQPEGFTRPAIALYGSEAGRAQQLYECFEQLRGRIDYRPGTTAWNLAGRQLYLATGARSTTLPFDALIVCAGATDRLMPVKGWNLAGSYSLGAAQIALKTQACALGQRTVFLGTGPLLYLIASQYLAAGAEVAAVLDTSTAGQRLAALPRLLAGPRQLWKGAGLLWRLRRGGVALHRGVRPLEILGDPTEGVSALRWRDAAGREQLTECDAIASGWHLRPETQLADLARCEFRFDAASRQWLPRIDAQGRSSVAGIYLAGDGARILGADAAERSGELAALAALHDLQRAPANTAQRAQQLEREISRLARFAAGLGAAFPWPAALPGQLPDDAVICRCEAITAGELRRLCAETGAREVNRAKAFSRVGMGRCQGRYCADASAELIASACGLPREQVGRLRSQAPVKPLPLGLAADAGDAIASNASAGARADAAPDTAHDAAGRRP